MVLEMVQVPELQRLAPTRRWLHNICFTLPIRQDKTRQFINARRVNRKGNYYNLTIHFPRYDHRALSADGRSEEGVVGGAIGGGFRK